MSSPGETPSYEAIVVQGQRPLGPIRLPIKDASAFADAFAETYRTLNLNIVAIEKKVATSRGDALASSALGSLATN